MSSVSQNSLSSTSPPVKATTPSIAKALFESGRRLQVFSHYYETPQIVEFAKPIPINFDGCFPGCVDFFLVPNPHQIKTLIREALDTKGNALINGDQGGVMLFGVDTAGYVQGFELVDEAQKDYIRKVVANFLQRFDPVITEKNYAVSFIPVKGASKGESPLFVVLEILLKTPVVPTLYQNTKGAVLLKQNDGKLEGPLRLSRIQQIIQDRYKKTFFADLSRQNDEKCEEKNVSGSQIEPAWIEPRLPNSVERGDDDDKEESGCKIGCFGKF